MPIIIVVNYPKSWKFEIPGVDVVSARDYIIEPKFSNSRGIKVFNLCRSYRYQSLGYYVSLLATARGHKVIPNVSTIQEMKAHEVTRIITEDLDDLIQKSLAHIQSREFTLSIYFGRNIAKRYDRLSTQLFNLFQAPFIRAHFVYNKKWQLQNISPITNSDIPGEHIPYVEDFAKRYFSGRRFTVPRRNVSGYDLAILVNPEEEEPPSNKRALQLFIKAAQRLDFDVELITKDDYSKLAEFDALFIRETTAVNHHTYRFALRAEAEGLAVIDDPRSIVRCTNKVYLAELMERHRVPTPKTVILHRDNREAAVRELGFPLVLKAPDSSFSQGVAKVHRLEDFMAESDRMLERSELIVAQQFLPTTFDWRVGILEGTPLFTCKYYMARKHWQVINWTSRGWRKYGEHETTAVEDAPAHVVRTALRAARLIGDGFYGVDIKQDGRKCYVIEVNDNPNVDAGTEDLLLKEDLYEFIMRVFLDRVQKLKEGKARQ
jgi:glutathione synthase/RimK-type ligase-like ATP-grasp enzyme